MIIFGFQPVQGLARSFIQMTRILISVLEIQGHSMNDARMKKKRRVDRIHVSIGKANVVWESC